MTSIESNPEGNHPLEKSDTPKTTRPPKIVIVGAGPTGLGAAWRLNELGHTNWTLLEAEPIAGGLARSFVDEAGFTWDIGGHVQFSHYSYFDELMNELLRDRWLTHEREAWAWLFGRFVPYPVQNNVHRFPPRALFDSLIGLMHAESSREHTLRRPDSFAEWLTLSFGTGLCKHFMFPYNEKVWAFPPQELGADWVGDRVARPDLKRILGNLVHDRDDVSWGPNNRFRFPRKGGTGAIWSELANRLPAGNLQYSSRVERVDLKERRVLVASGPNKSPHYERYDKLISTLPLDTLLRLVNDDGLPQKAGQFKYSTSHIIGIGLQGQPPAQLRTKCWMYFSEPEYPFYRVTVFSNYSPLNVPDPSRTWSLMAEVASRPSLPVDEAQLIRTVITALEQAQLVSRADKVASTWYFRAEHGYPTPFRGRDDVIAPIHQVLEGHDVFSRGRFGAWKYEVSNQDHSVMQGVECVNRILFGTPEMTLNRPSVVNGR